MIKIKYDINLMKFISMFETITRAQVKDCFEIGERLVFVVKEGNIGKALGKGGSNVKRLERMLKKKLRIIEFNPDLIQFIKNVVFPSKVKEIVEEDKIITITPLDSETRGYLIGRGAVNLNVTKEIVRRYFEITDIKVI
ncbi:NusA-like transcription termination signal-binding factor [Candidatus Woesearchaeota archaeon]|nr:NusA-like transcription termination signal-binding factor [Candidatus Woesearchaeota archaeon]